MPVQHGSVHWRGDVAQQLVKAAALRGLAIGGEHILGESRRVVPLDEGTLARSGTVVVDEDEMAAVIAYDTPYAVRQHEDLTFRHAPGRQAKYLEEPLLRERGTALALVAAQIRRATR